MDIKSILIAFMLVSTSTSYKIFRRDIEDEKALAESQLNLENVENIPAELRENRAAILGDEPWLEGDNSIEVFNHKIEKKRDNGDDKDIKVKNPKNYVVTWKSKLYHTSLGNVRGYMGSNELGYSKFIIEITSKQQMEPYMQYAYESLMKNEILRKNNRPTSNKKHMKKVINKTYDELTQNNNDSSYNTQTTVHFTNQTKSQLTENSNDDSNKTQTMDQFDNENNDQLTDIDNNNSNKTEMTQFMNQTAQYMDQMNEEIEKSNNSFNKTNDDTAQVTNQTLPLYDSFRK